MAHSSQSSAPLDDAAMLRLMIDAAVEAATVIMQVYSRPFTAKQKADGSPVTEADARAEDVVLRHLAVTGLPVLAEESVAAGKIPVLGRDFFVVDPLDGTREFLKRNGEFTVNIALCRDGAPRLGVVLAPATGAMYWGGNGRAFEAVSTPGGVSAERPMHVLAEGPLRIVASRSHGHAALRTLCDNMAVVADVSVGSSLKFCMLASGAAQVYPRFTPTSEWDTAAGQAILEAAGGVVLDLDGAPLTCGHPDRSFLNGYFIAAASRDLADRARREMRHALTAD